MLEVIETTTVPTYRMLQVPISEIVIMTLGRECSIAFSIGARSKQEPGLKRLFKEGSEVGHRGGGPRTLDY